MSWTEDQITELVKLWNEGKTTAEIGRALGKTKNAVVGKAHRLSLSARPSPIKRSKAAETATPSAKKAAARTPKAPPQQPEAQGKRKPLCQWPFGHPDMPDFHFCLKPALPSKPYCAEHCAVAYIPLTRKGETRSVAPKAIGKSQGSQPG